MPSPDLARRLSGVDAAFLYLERKEIPLHIAAVCIFEGEIPFQPFVRAIDSRLHLLPRYRQVVADPPFHLGYPTWQDDPGFNIRRHIFRHHLDHPGGQPELEALAGHILSQVMDRRKPLWDIHLVDGLEGGKGAAIVRIHHSLADGVAGASIMKIILDATPAGSHALRKPRRKPAGVVAPSQSIVDALASGVHSSLESMISAEAVLLSFSQTLTEPRTREAFEKLITLLPEMAASSGRFVFNRPCSDERKFCWTEFPFAGVQAIRERAGGTANDVLLSILARAVSQYVRLHGESPAGRFLRVMCPVNVRQDGGQTMGNQITFLPVALPLGIASPIRTLREVSARTEVMKNAHAAHLIALLASWLGAAPPPLQALFWKAIPQLPLPVPLLHMICTNVPGSPTPLYAVGRRMIASYPHVPTGYELGVNCAVQSYDGQLYCGFTADAKVVPDVERLRDFMHASYEELHRAASRRPAPRPRTEARHAVAV
ncbi:MAG TPA: wax ester/triacylglycerol synthase family O-acyltransferase [Bryobacteraceae bacterium]|nr:wax ester/triacylglycerol synthase family O-acyltransferase [Bryobacteraceae bacterium]